MNLNPGSFLSAARTSGLLSRRSRMKRRPSRRLVGGNRVGYSLEGLENRWMLSGDPVWQNKDFPEDVNRDGYLTSRDVLIVVNDLNRHGSRAMDSSAQANGMVDVNGDGFVTSRDVLQVINAIHRAEGEGELVRIRLVATSTTSETALTSLGPNQDFLLRAYVQDISARQEDVLGVFAAWLDVNYTSALAAPTGAIQFSSTYTLERSGSTTTAGLIDEVGGARVSATPSLGTDSVLLFSVPMRTSATGGSLVFSGDPADDLPRHETLLAGRDPAVISDDIDYVGTTIQIVTGSSSPVGVNDTYVATEDTTLNVSAASGVLANDTDADGNSLTAVLVQTTANGTLTLNADGSFAYRPTTDFNGTDTFTYRASDGTNTSGLTTVTLTVNAVNDAPRATGEKYTVAANSTLPIIAPGILANDVDVEGSTITAVMQTNSGRGAMVLRANGSFTYSPIAGLNGVDFFTYVVSDGSLTSQPATAVIVVGNNQRPQATGDQYQTNEDTALTVGIFNGLLANDSDPNSDGLNVVQVTGPLNGTLTLESSGGFVYTPDPDFSGTDSFTYTATDRDLESEPVTVTIQVVAAADEPVAVADSYTVAEDGALNLSAPGVLANDSGGAGSLSAVLVSNVSQGSLTLNANGSLVYTPTANFSGTDSFTYKANDSLVDSNTVTVSLTVTSVNDAPVGTSDRYTVTPGQITVIPVAQGVLANDSDVDSTTLTAAIATNVTSGTLTLNNNGSFSYTPNNGFTGQDSFTYRVSDGTTTSSPVTVTLVVGEVTGQVAVSVQVTDLAGNVITSVNTGGAFQLQVFIQDTSAEPREGVFAAFADVAFNSALATATGAIVVSSNFPDGRSGNTTTPGLIDEAGGFAGLSSAAGGSKVLVFSVPMQATAAGTVTFATNRADTSPAHDILLFDEPDPIPFDQIVYGSTTLTILGEASPVAVNDSYTADNDTALIVNAAEGVLANDIRVNGGGLTAALVNTTSQGTLTLNADGSFRYVPNAGFVGTDTFTYRAVSVASSSAPATVTITVGALDRGSVAGFVYFDANNNGSKDNVEHGFGGLEVSLKGTDTLGNAVSQTTQTDQNGFYTFGNLLRGRYVISQAKPAIVLDGVDSRNGVVSSANDSFTVDLGNGADLTGFNFGERGLLPQYISVTDFFSRLPPQGVGAAIVGGKQSWYCMDGGWDGFKDVKLDLSSDRSIVTVTATDTVGGIHSATVAVQGNSLVKILGNARDGWLVKLTAPSSSYGLRPVTQINAAAVDALFGS